VYRIARELHFCYGHRLLLHDGRCAHLHGHNARVILVLEAPDVDPGGMVVDFQVVRARVGDWIDAELDHRMLLHRDDPAAAALRRLGEPVVELDFHPTAENLARHVFEHARSAGLPVAEVEFWETATCRASYRGR
jgi:6-pyruvoyltetrahydropterin/6-carboxytetrahydropterin synthase